MQKQQVLVIHGGGNFIPKHGETILEMIAASEVSLPRMRRSVDWKATLQEKLGDAYDVLSPRMPNADAPRYEEWKRYFEKILPLLEPDALYVGHSLGAMFLAKYFSESPVQSKPVALFLVAPPFTALGFGWELSTIENLRSHADTLFFYHSTDDAVVDYAESARYKERIPGATFRELDDRGHFNNDNFPEIALDIWNL